MYQRILVPVDGSTSSSRGLDEAVMLAKLTGASLRLVHVVDALSFTACLEKGAACTDDVVPTLKKAGQEILEQARASVAASGIAVDTLLCESLAVRTSTLVVEEANAWNADLIVIGAHGRRGTRQWMLGSDAEQILRVSPMPVLLVRLPGTESSGVLRRKSAAPFAGGQIDAP